MSDQESKGNNIDKKVKDRYQEARVVRKIVFTTVLVICILLIGGIVGGSIYIKSALKPVDPSNTEVKDITIPIGSSGRTIATTLEENGVIKNAKLFRYYVKFKNESGFQAGHYQLSPSMEIDEIIASLKTGKVVEEPVFKMTIPEGIWLDRISEIIAEKTPYTTEEVFEKLNDEEYISELISLYPNLLSEEILNENIRHPLEGYLFPATYEFFEEEPSIESIIEKMLNQTELVLSPYMEQIKEREYSLHEFLTMASIIEEEATAAADRQHIASVFYNRIDISMPLQTDPTVLYSLGNHKVQITYDDLEVQSPYNTYVIAGLPIGPIANPGEMSIQAALNPKETDDLYFYSRPNGQTLFSSTLQEHNRNKNKYKHEWDEYKN